MNQEQEYTSVFPDGEFVDPEYLIVDGELDQTDDELVREPDIEILSSDFMRARAHAQRVQGVLRYPDFGEQRIVKLAQEHDEIALSELYERYQPGILKYIYFRIGEESEAQDLASTVFLRAFTSIHEFTFRGVPFSAWLYRIASNAVIDHFRRQPGTPELSLEEKLIGAPTEDQDGTISILQHQALQAAVMELTEEQQAVVMYKFVYGASNKDVAQILGKTEGAVKSLQHRALASLGRILEIQGFEPETAHHTTLAPADVPDSIRYSFEIARFRLFTHIVNQELVSTNPERATTRRNIWENHIGPFIDTHLDSLSQKVLFQLIYEDMEIAEIKADLPRGHNVNQILSEAREQIVAYLQTETSMTFEELYDLFKGTGALYAIARPERTRYLRELKERRERIKKPRLPNHAYERLVLEHQDLHRLFSSPGKNGTENGNGVDIDGIIASSIPVYIASGQVVQPIEGHTLVVHRGVISVVEEEQDGEISHYRSPRQITAGRGHEVGVGIGAFGGFNRVTPGFETKSHCIVRLIHRDAAVPPHSKDEVSIRRRQVMEAYAHLRFVQNIRILASRTVPANVLLAHFYAAGGQPDQLDQQGRMLDLTNGLKLLTAKQLNVLDLFYREGLSDEKIRERLGVPSVSSIVDIRKRALKTVQDHLDITL